MKKLFLFIVCLIYGTLTLQAGPNNLGKGIKELTKKMWRIATKSSSRVKSSQPATKRPSTPVNELTQKATAPKSTRQGISQIVTEPRTLTVPSNRVTTAITPTALTRSIRRAEKELANKHQGLGQTVLLIPDAAKEKYPLVFEPGEEPGFSMSIIKKMYNGKEEIFGIIATHAIPNNIIEAPYKFGVTRKFQAKLPLTDGTERVISAQVVQISPVSMLDISLVKFDPEVEHLLKPMEYISQPPKVDQTVFSFGFANSTPVLSSRVVKKNSNFSIQTTKIEVGKNSSGYCGSLVFNEEGQAIGIHTGSINDISYATHAHFIDNLIEAYHNNGKSVYNLELNGHVLTTINVDEFISSFSLVDENFEILYKHEAGVNVYGVPTRYSETRIQQALAAHPEAKYLILHSRKAYWEPAKAGEFALIEDTKPFPTVQNKTREHIYDLEFYDPMVIMEQPNMFIIKPTF